MRRVMLAGTDLAASVLGCGSAGGAIDDGERLRLLQLAFDRGVTHFDTARAYGMGGAERIIGRFIADKRDQVTVTTKLGIVPPRRGVLLRSARAGARAVERILPSLGGRAKQAAGRTMLTGGRFTVADARGSLETSLRELGTDRVDVLLLHECAPEDVRDDLLGFLDGSVSQGKARYTGIATNPERTGRILEQGHGFPAIVQVANSAVEPNLERLSLRERAVITHSSLGQVQRVHAALLAAPGPLRAWSDAVEVDLADDRTLSALLLAYALRANADGIVLFYSTREDHIVADTALASGRTFADEQLDVFAGLVLDGPASPEV